MKKILFFCFTILISNLWGLFAIDPVAVTSITIDPSTSKATIKWNKSNDVLVDGYQIQRVVVGSLTKYEEITTIYDKNTTQYEFSPVDTLKSEYYTIVAVDTSNGTPDLSVATSIHSTIKPILTFDSCQSSISIKWNSYKGWSLVNSYNIFTYPGNIPIALGIRDTTFLLTKATANIKYDFFVEAVYNEQLKSTSYRSSIYTAQQSPPDYIYATATTEGAGVKIKCTIGPNGEITKYMLQKAIALTGVYFNVQEFSGLQPAIEYTDNDVLVASRKYSYKLLGLNNCGVASTSSEATNNIVLEAQNRTNIVKLEWQPFEPESGVKTYTLVRLFNNTLSENISVTGTIYNDDLSQFEFLNKSGELCYYVEHEDSTGGFISKSNTVCLSANSNLYVPNAFTPNGDGVNDLFFPIIDFVPAEFYLLIYNLWGNIVLETKDPAQGWNGTFNGAKVPQGVYIYSLSIKTLEGKASYKRGEIGLILP